MPTPVTLTKATILIVAFVLLAVGSTPGQPAALEPSSSPAAPQETKIAAPGPVPALSSQESPAAGGATSRPLPLTASRGVASDDLLFFPPGTSTLPVFPVPDPLATTLRILTSLAFVIALVFGLSWLLQRRGPLGGQPIGRVLGILPLDGHRSVYVVDILGKVLMLGVADHGVTLLGEVTDKLVIDELRLAARHPGLPGLEKLFKFLHRGDRPPTEETQSSPMQSFAEADFSHHTRRAQEQARQMENLLLKRPAPPGDR